MKVKLSLLIILALTAACSNPNLSTDAKTAETDSLLVAYRKEAQINPANTIQKIKIMQEPVKDSLIYHKLNEVLAIGYFMDNKNDSAFIFGKKSIQFCEAQKQDNPDIMKLLTIAYNDIGVFSQISGQHDSAIIYLEKAANTANKSGEKNKLPGIYINLADNYNQKGDYPNAASRYRKALFLADSLNLNDELNSIYNGLAQIYTDLKNYEQADYYFNKVESIFDTLPAFDQYFFANTKGNSLYSRHEYEKALPWVKKANTASKIYGQQSTIAVTDGNLGELFLLLNCPDSAKYYFDKAAVHFLSDDASPSSKFYMNGLFASYYLETGDLQKAQAYLSQAYDKNQINPLYIYYNNKRLEDLYKRQGNYKKAYDLSQITKVFDDSLRNVTVQNNIAEIDSRYRQDTIVLKRDIQLAQKEQKLLETEKTNLFVISLFVITALIVIVIALYSRKKRELQQICQMSIITQLRMESIRNRISPHFMFNVLNSVVPNLREHEDLIRPMQLLVESIRGNLALSGKLAITLDEEIKTVKTYLELVESIQPGDRPKVCWEISPEVDKATLVPSMILQIPVENALKYAFVENKEEKLLVINISMKDNILNLEIQDNGIGFNAKRNSDTTKGTGSGLNILYKTIEMLNVINNKKMEFEIKNEVNISLNSYGTKVLIKIPSDYKYEL